MRVREKLIVVPRNPSGARYATGAARSKTRLSLVSSKKNQIIDDEPWREKHKAALPQRERPAELPEAFLGADKFVSLTPGQITSAIYSKIGPGGGDKVAIFEGQPGPTPSYGFDFAKWVQNGKALWIYAAHVEGDILYVIASYPGYANEIGGKTGYLAAPDVKTGKLLWQTGPRVANSYNLAVGSDFLICGYGFTAEPDYLFVVDKKTGRTLQRIPMKTAPEHIALEGNQLFVRCYNTDYIFKVR
ncbi:MAG: hypothetical protein QM758_19300 [Armatimonas sp.]